VTAGAAHLPCDEGVIRTRTGGAPRAGQGGAWVLAATILGSVMAFVDGTVVNVALPALQQALGADVADVQWVVESYALALAALLLAGGSLGDRFGRRRVFGTGVALFAAASVGCGVAPDVRWLIGMRAVQGVGGALLVPGSLALISASFPPERRGRAIGTWSGVSAVAAGFGPVLGGWLIENASWRWIFFVNVLPAAAVLLILPRVPESRDPDAGRLDVPGAVLVTLGLGGLVYGLIEAGRFGWMHPAVLGSMLLGAAALAVFAGVERRARSPMVPLGLFRSRTFAGANLLTFLLYAALGGALFFLPFNLIQVQGYGATAAGAAFLPFIALMSVLSRWSGGLVDRYGARLPLTVGPLVAAAGFALHALPGVGGSYWTTFFPGVVVLGLGMAVSVAPLTTAVMGAVESRHAGVASGINNAVSRTASLVAVAAFGLLALGGFGRSMDGRMEALRAPAEVRAAMMAQRIRLAEAEAPAGMDAAGRAMIDRAVDLSFVDAFRWVMLVAAGLAVASAGAAWGMIRDEERQESQGIGNRE
jgi:EmrB/QacA subfamily drug resistance transporter